MLLGSLMPPLTEKVSENEPRDSESRCLLGHTSLSCHLHTESVFAIAQPSPSGARRKGPGPVVLFIPTAPGLVLQKKNHEIFLPAFGS